VFFARTCWQYIHCTERHYPLLAFICIRSFAKLSYLVFFLGAELHESSVHIVQWRRGQSRSRALRLGLGGRARRRSARRSRGRTSRGTWGRHRGAILQGLQWGLQRGLKRSSMGIDTVGHQSAVRSWDGTRTSWASRGGRCAIGGAGVAIGRTDSVRGWLGGLGRLRRVGVTAQTGTLEKMLFLARGVLCANLLAVDTLH
jgi:hypothetical protein